MGIILNLLKWIPLNIASVFGVLQAVVKLFKELVTAVLNFLMALVAIIPNAKLDKANVIVLKARELIEKADAGLQAIKDKVLGWAHQ